MVIFLALGPCHPKVLEMPAEVFDPEEFIRISERADYCMVKRSGDVVKLKLRTPGKLYTLKVKPEEADAIISRLKCEVVSAP